MEKTKEKIYYFTRIVNNIPEEIEVKESELEEKHMKVLAGEFVVKFRELPEKAQDMVKKSI